MSDTPEHVAATESEVVMPDGAAPEEDGPQEFIEQPAKVMRVGAMLRGLLEELREASLDESSRDRLRDIYETSVDELGSALSPDLHAELDRLALPFSDDEIPSESELHVAKAQLVGWLEGLIQGIQATLFAQQMAAQQQLQGMRQPGQLARPGGGQPGQPMQPGQPLPQGGQAPGGAPASHPPGTYL